MHRIRHALRRRYERCPHIAGIPSRTSRKPLRGPRRAEGCWDTFGEQSSVLGAFPRERADEADRTVPRLGYRRAEPAPLEDLDIVRPEVRPVHHQASARPPCHRPPETVGGYARVATHGAHRLQQPALIKGAVHRRGDHGGAGAPYWAVGEGAPDLPVTQDSDDGGHQDADGEACGVLVGRYVLEGGDPHARDGDARVAPAHAAVHLIHRPAHCDVEVLAPGHARALRVRGFKRNRGGTPKRV